HDQPPNVRREQYNCDDTYGTNAEFGFDYLRDNGMATRKEEQVQRGHYYAIVDEVDSILIDEARTPLIISGPAVITYDEQYAQFKPQVLSLYQAQERLCNRFLSEAETLLRKLHPEDGSNVADGSLIEREAGLLLYRVKIGQPKSEGLLKVLEDPENLRLMNQAELQLHADQKEFETKAQRIHAISQLLKAFCLYQKDVQYVIQDNKVIIVDENTGRLMTGRRWSDGLHQAVEAKEEVAIERETQTLATITIQNYF